ncbi:MAG: dihydrodipicolinate synthase family protein [Thermoproteota archaeon]
MGKVLIPSVRFGLIPATITPMDKTFKVDYEQLENYIDWISKFKIGGVAVNVDTGEGPHLYAEERATIIKTYARKVGGRFPIIAGLHARNTEEAVKLGKEAKEAGANGLLVFPHPAFMGERSEDLIYAYHKEISEKVGLPIILFQLQPLLGGTEFRKEVLEKLVEIENVVAIKEASFDAKKFIDTVRILEKAPKKITILTGNDNFIYESLVMGAEGGLLGFGTIAVDRQVEMFQLAAEGRYRESGEIWDELLLLEEVIFAPPVRDYRARLKVALKIMGVLETEFVRPPLLAINREEEERIRATLKNLRMV